MTWRHALSLTAEGLFMLVLLFGLTVFLVAGFESVRRLWRRWTVRRELSTLDRISLEATARLGRDDQ